MKILKIKRIIKKILKYIIIIILILLCIYNITYIIGKEYNEKFNVEIFGYKFSLVTVEAMSPEIKYKDVIVYKDVNIQELEEKDIIVFYKNNIQVIRRIVSKEQIGKNTEFITKGDNYLYNDPGKLTIDDIEGKVCKVFPHFGVILKILQSRILTFVITIILLIIFMENKRKINKSKYRKKIREVKKTS